ncbi:MAG: acyltransferase family protein [Winogradskyella sp.]|uniref:acyltransferase family protein n=1 Tax=Winogradskyella sp. TaxID=1883156 RepID=UPI00385A370B
MRRKRLIEIDIASGIAISLVVFGHLSDYDPSWYGICKNTLYKFHMPFFMFISGFLLSYTGENYKDFQSIKQFIFSKVIRFGIPYLFMSFLFLIVKIGLKEYSSENSIFAQVLAIFIEPTSGPSIFLWYIYVLFQFYVVFTLLHLISLIKKHQFLLIGIGLVLYLFESVSNIFVLNLFCKYFLFFSIGFVTVNYHSNFKIFIKNNGFLAVLVFILLIILDLSIVIQVPTLVMGLISIPVFTYLSTRIKNNKILEYIGQSTFVIYIWNSVFIFVLSFLFKSIDADFLGNFGFYLPFMVFAGIYGPLAMRTASRKLGFQFLKKIFP